MKKIKTKSKNQVIVVPTTQKTKSTKTLVKNKKVAKKTKSLTVSTRSSPKTLKKVSSSTPDYYTCLLNYSQQGFYDASENKKLKIHACCKKCKESAPALNSQREKELVKLITSYKQVGDSLKKLLKPIN